MFVEYRPRPLAFLGIETVEGYSLKVYSIRARSDPFNRTRFADGWHFARESLPQPALAAGRPGVGFAVLHAGRTADYLVLGWWERENELPIRVFVRAADGWRPAADGESFCVWDLRVIWWEREAYVNTLLAGRPPEEYLGATIAGFA